MVCRTAHDDRVDVCVVPAAAENGRVSAVDVCDEQVCSHDRFDGRVRSVLPDSGSGEEAYESGNEEHGVWRARGVRRRSARCSFSSERTR